MADSKSTTPPSLQSLGLGGIRHLLRVDGRKEVPAKVLEKAFVAGMTFVDVTKCCGCPEVGRLLRKHREQVSIAAAFDLSLCGREKAVVTPAVPEPTSFHRANVVKIVGDEGFTPPRLSIRESCDKILSDLGVDCIDLFYQSGDSCEASVLDGLAELQVLNESQSKLWGFLVGDMQSMNLWMQDLVKEGKIRCIGLAACDPGILRRAHAMHSISAVTIPWCLWGAGESLALIHVCKELGISILATDPLGWGLIPTSWTEPAEVRSKVNAIVVQQHKMLLERVQKIQSKPGQILKRRAKAAALGQSGRVDAFIKRIFARQDSVFLEKLRTRVAKTWTRLPDRIEVIMQKQRQKMNNLMEMVLHENFDMLTRKLNALDGKSDVHIQGVVESVLLSLTGTILSKVLALRSQQKELLLEKLKKRTGDNSAVSKLAAKIFAMHKERAISRVQTFRTGQVNFLMGRLETIQAKKRSQSVELVRTAIVRRHETMAQRVSEVLGKRSRLDLPDAISGAINKKCDALKARMTKGADFCFNNMVTRCARVTSRQGPKIVDTIHGVVERRTEKLVDRALLVTGKSNSVSADDLVHTGKVVLERGSVLNRRMRRIAREKGCDADVLALAWLRAQGGDVFVVNQVCGTKGVIRAAEANQLVLSDSELGRFAEALNEFHMPPAVVSSEWVEVQKEDDWEVLSVG